MQSELQLMTEERDREKRAKEAAEREGERMEKVRHSEVTQVTRRLKRYIETVCKTAIHYYRRGTVLFERRSRRGETERGESR